MARPRRRQLSSLQCPERTPESPKQSVPKKRKPKRIYRSREVSPAWRSRYGCGRLHWCMRSHGKIHPRSKSRKQASSFSKSAADMLNSSVRDHGTDNLVPVTSRSTQTEIMKYDIMLSAHLDFDSENSMKGSESCDSVFIMDLHVVGGHSPDGDFCNDSSYPSRPRRKAANEALKRIHDYYRPRRR